MARTRQSSGTRLLDVREAAAVAGCNPETVRRWIWAGKLPSVRRGRRVFIDRDELERVSGSSQPVDLAEWSRRAKAAREKPGASSQGSAADLVLSDRVERSETAGRSR